jgi:hypothetical protein
VATEVIPPPPDAPADDKGAIPAPPAEKPKHPWVEATEVAMRSRHDPGAPLVAPSAGLGKTAEEQAKNLEHPASLLASTAANIMSPGLGLAGRVGVQSAAGAVKSGAKGENPLWGAFVDALTTGATEGLLSLIPGLAKIPKVTRSLGEMAEKVRSTRGGEASVAPRIDKAIDLVRSRLPSKPFLNVPALDKTKLLTLDEAAALLKAKGLTGEQFQLARAQLVHALNAAEAGAVKAGVRATGQSAPVKPYAGSIFGKFSPQEHFTYRPSGPERAAESIVGGIESPAVRSAIDAATTTDVGGPRSNLPIGTAALGAAGSSFGDIAKTIMRFGR